eukprot:11950537-Alexandrium_andersonii.AAC.2
MAVALLRCSVCVLGGECAPASFVALVASRLGQYALLGSDAPRGLGRLAAVLGGAVAPRECHILHGRMLRNERVAAAS